MTAPLVLEMICQITFKKICASGLLYHHSGMRMSTVPKSSEIYIYSFSRHLLFHLPFIPPTFLHNILQLCPSFGNYFLFYETELIPLIISNLTDIYFIENFQVSNEIVSQSLS